MIDEQEAHLRKSALVMRIVGWSLIPALLLGFVLYTPGFTWGTLPEGIPLGPAHPPSTYDGLHPYVFMLVALYAGWAILLIRGARDPRANAALFDWGILANLLHGLGGYSASLRAVRSHVDLASQPGPWIVPLIQNWRNDVQH